MFLNLVINDYPITESPSILIDLVISFNILKSYKIFHDHLSINYILIFLVKHNQFTLRPMSAFLIHYHNLNFIFILIIFSLYLNLLVNFPI